MLGRGMIARCADDEDARQLLAEGLRTSKKMGTRETTWQIQRELALHHRDRGEYRKALDYFQDAIETLKQITETLDEEELKVSYLEVPIRKRIFDEIKEMRRQTK
jgi:tetratricopeptide (TPR) repeat protein